MVTKRKDTAKREEPVEAPSVEAVAEPLAEPKDTAVYHAAFGPHGKPIWRSEDGTKTKPREV